MRWADPISILMSASPSETEYDTRRPTTHRRFASAPKLCKRACPCGMRQRATAPATAPPPARRTGTRSRALVIET
eukprot:5167336-Prymnesium_polylepis.1